MTTLSYLLLHLDLFSVKQDELTEPPTKRFQQRSPSVVLMELSNGETGRVDGNDMLSDKAAISAKKKIQLFERKQYENSKVSFCFV